MADGLNKVQILLAYQKANGIESLAVPPNTGALRAIYAVPLVAILGGAVGLGFTVRRWRASGARKRAEAAVDRGKAPLPARDEYDARLDRELEDLDG